MGTPKNITAKIIVTTFFRGRDSVFVIVHGCQNVSVVVKSRQNAIKNYRCENMQVVLRVRPRGKAIDAIKIVRKELQFAKSVPL